MALKHLLLLLLAVANASEHCIDRSDESCTGPEAILLQTKLARGHEVAKVEKAANPHHEPEVAEVAKVEKAANPHHEPEVAETSAVAVKAEAGVPLMGHTPEETYDLFSNTMVRYVTLTFCAIAVILLLLSMSEPLFLYMSGKEEAVDEDPVEHDCEPLEDQIFHLAVVTLVHDLRYLDRNDSTFFKRAARFGVTMMIVIFYMGLQIFLLEALDAVMAEPAVAEIRASYNIYEQAMYDKSNVKEILPGIFRGDHGTIRPANWAKLSEEEVSMICKIPMSHPSYLFAALLVWVFVAMSTLRGEVELAWRIMISTPTVATQNESFEESDDGQTTVVGLTPVAKGMVFGLILGPSLFCTVTLLSLGIKWLLATQNEADLFLNSVALEVFMMLKEFMFKLVVSARGRRLMGNTVFQPITKVDHASYPSMAGATFWGIGAIVLVERIMYAWQDVLPLFGHDIRPECRAHGMIGVF